MTGNDGGKNQRLIRKKSNISFDTSNVRGNFSTCTAFAYELSTSLKMRIVYRTLEKLEEALDGNIHPEAMIHSDQGVHYTHPEFQQRVKKVGLLQSMSRRGNCIDNALMESFFGHFKDDVDFKSANNLFELKQMVDRYMKYYNTSRKQWNLKKMAPAEYRNHLIAA